MFSKAKVKRSSYFPLPIKSSYDKVLLFQTTTFISLSPSIRLNVNFSWNVGVLPPSKKNENPNYALDPRSQILTLDPKSQIGNKKEKTELFITCAGSCTEFGATIFKTNIRILPWNPFSILQFVTTDDCHNQKKKKIQHKKKEGKQKLPNGNKQKNMINLRNKRTSDLKKLALNTRNRHWSIRRWRRKKNKEKMMEAFEWELVHWPTLAKRGGHAIYIKKKYKKESSEKKIGKRENERTPEMVRLQNPRCWIDSTLRKSKLGLVLCTGIGSWLN